MSFEEGGGYKVGRGGQRPRSLVEFESNETREEEKGEGKPDSFSSSPSRDRSKNIGWMRNKCMRLQRIATDLGEPLLRVEYLDEQRHLIVHYLEPVSWLSKQLLYRLRGGERGGGARGRRRASRPGAPCARRAAVVQMGASEKDRIAVRRDAAVERAKR